MPEVASPIILVGPTTVGKSEVAIEIANRIPSVLINADKYGLYARPEFAIGFGIDPEEFDNNHQRELYGTFSPFDPLPTTEAYVELAKGAVERTHALGNLAVIEGCSFRYNMALLDHFGIQHGVNLTWISREGLEDKVAERARKAFDNGLLTETERALAAGYGGTVPMTSMLYRPALRVLSGEITVDEAIDRIKENAFDNIFEHDAAYADTSGLHRIAHDRRHVGHTIDAIISPNK